MALKQVLDVYEILDDIHVNGEVVTEYAKSKGILDATYTRVDEGKGPTDFIRLVIPGRNGKLNGGKAPTLGIIGQLGGIGARPERIGFVSDGDGALSAVATAIKLIDMVGKGDQIDGDVIVSTHICPTAPTMPHDPVPFMGSPVDMATNVKLTVDPDMDAILSVDTTKGNRILNKRGFALTPTVKAGYILHISEDLLQIQQTSTGELPCVLALTTQDITPYGNGLYHMNSILQPCCGTDAPVVGVAITTESSVPGCATGATHEVDVAEVVQFCVEAAKEFTAGKCSFYDKDEFEMIQKLYGSMKVLQTRGNQ
ncbi:MULTISPECIES: DUF1177 domain-containing protein [Dialister]|jgi:hypothetical protein|uniref:DUF1177 domain-containing protein n=1 Tax=Dialister hominis TaxID=2582419 RepID=A0A8D5A599_9FIRM|nr:MULTISPECIES: DUF1177 domain-containing protein [Dialister]MBS6413347.1 DUF1177 domain-containing protein [Dialister sp.]MCH3930581.1 DUF1177 domain-containing protein [Dialister sp.]MEE1350079.1 DUF1177 domain-containing protein [Dialister hominis]BBK25734.1 hypothetical protein Dia5BBH33_16690 [Dialister hominis]